MATLFSDVVSSTFSGLGHVMSEHVCSFLSLMFWLVVRQQKEPNARG